MTRELKDKVKEISSFDPVAFLGVEEIIDEDLKESLRKEFRENVFYKISILVSEELDKKVLNSEQEEKMTIALKESKNIEDVLNLVQTLFGEDFLEKIIQTFEESKQKLSANNK